MHYVFITGGVASSLGKGLACSIFGFSLLQLRKFKIRIRKLRSIFKCRSRNNESLSAWRSIMLQMMVLKQILDLGHYERFTNVSANQSVIVFLQVKIYSNVLT